MHTAVNPPSIANTAAARYLSCLPLQEILVLQGTPLLGAALGFRHAAAAQTVPLAILLLANLCLVAHIFALNDWSNLAADLIDPNKAADVYTMRGVSQRELRALTLGLLAAGLVFINLLGLISLFVAIGVVAMSALYSLPQFNWKGRPFLNSLAHLTGGVLHFLLGYSVGHAIDRRGIITATFFAVTFAAGHLTQEVRDYRGDVLNAIRTNAVIFGPRRTFAASLAMFTLSHALLLALALTGVLPHALAALVLLYPIQLWWSLRTLEEGLTYASVSRLQSRYRALYAVVGLFVVAALGLA